MPMLQVVVLAVVQGLTEFLPVSSTAHLALIPWIFHWKDPGLEFDVALHVGTLVAVLLYFFKTWVDLLLLGFGAKPVFDTADFKSGSDEHRALLWFLALGTIPAAVVGWAFQKQVETTWRSPLIIAAALIGVAVLMAVAEKMGREQKELASAGLADSMWIGVSQAFALVPGVSRSGITITAGLLRDLRREAAAKFSFLLATPVVAGAALKEFLTFPHHRVPAEMQMPFGVGIIVSALVGFATIAFFLKYLQFGTLKIFIYYRIFFGIIILALAFFFQLGTGF